ncbi:LysR family transcriptional regulator [Jiella endophytica]|uniref:LysR family transcriptional regulator n=1 Tax=Jiella endophytica TaxID=2558362 RepID=A0A4Y8RD58_9HYPH|nr:LysR family transcriptional regulator [Jiella endophytica]
MGEPHAGQEQAAQRHPERADDVAAEATRLRGSARGGEVVLFCQLCEAFYWLTPRLAGFHAAHPEIELRLQSSIRPLTESGGGFDVAIQTAGRPSGTSRLAFAVDDVVFPVCSPDYLGETTPPLRLEALQEHRLLSHRVAPQDWLDWPDFFALAGLPQAVAKNVMAFDSYPLVLQAAIAGQGIALGWRRTVSGLLADGSLLRPCRESLDRPREFCVYVSPQAGNRAETGALLAWLRRELAS